MSYHLSYCTPSKKSGQLVYFAVTIDDEGETHSCKMCARHDKAWSFKSDYRGDDTAHFYYMLAKTAEHADRCH